MSGSLGALRIHSASQLLVSARIYNQPAGTPLSDSTGVFFAGVPASLAIGTGGQGALQGVTQDQNFRYNFFMVEVAGRTAILHVKLLDSTGAVAGEKDYGLLAYSWSMSPTSCRPCRSTADSCSRA